MIINRNIGNLTLFPVIFVGRNNEFVILGRREEEGAWLQERRTEGCFEAQVSLPCLFKCFDLAEVDETIVPCSLNTHWAVKQLDSISIELD